MESPALFIRTVSSILFLLWVWSPASARGQQDRLPVGSAQRYDEPDSAVGRGHRPFATQDLVFRRHKLRFRSGYESLKMDTEPDLGMVGIGVDLFIADRLPNFYLTLNSYSAIIGTRPGLISFGTGLGYVQPFFHSPLSLDAGVFVGGGGGGGAPDGGGLITRAHVDLSYTWQNLSVFGGFSRLDFPTGDMGSSNFNAGIAVSSNFYTTHRVGERLAERSAASAERISALGESRTRVSLLGLRYLGFAEGPTLSDGPIVPDGDAGAIHLIGVELDQFFHEKWYAALKLHGAVAGGIDGYMSYLVGLGFDQALGTERLHLDAQVLAGPSGGGKVASGGGGTLQAALALRARLSNAYELKAAVGQTMAPGGHFHGTFLELGLSRNFNFLSPETGTARLYRMKSDEVLHHTGLEIQNRTYFSPDLPDKNGYRYDPAFNLLGFLLSKQINRNFAVLGATYWAYQGSYGAYAEGLLGLGYRYAFAPAWSVRAQVLGGAAGGGGIDVGNGLVFQYSAGIARAIGTDWGLTLSGGKMQGVRGNFNPFFLDFGLSYRFSSLSKG